MTDSEWWGAEEPGPLLDAAAGRATDRQLRLFACACARSVWGFVPEGLCRDAVEVALRFADGRATADELVAARGAAIPEAGRAGPNAAAAWAACEAANPSARKAARVCASEAQEQVRRTSRAAAADEARAQVGFLRDIVGDPDRNVRTDPAGRLGGHPLVREIAEGLYAGGPEEDLAALADALEGIGCRSFGLLEHCRSPGPHVRGCWALDVLLGYEAKPEPEPEPDPAGPSRWSRQAEVLASALAAVPARGQPGRVDALRGALAIALGPKKYRRCLRRAIEQ